MTCWYDQITVTESKGFTSLVWWHNPPSAEVNWGKWSCKQTIRSVSKSGQNGMRAIQEAIIDGQGDILNNAPAVRSEKEREVLLRSQRHLLMAVWQTRPAVVPLPAKWWGRDNQARESPIAMQKLPYNTICQRAILRMRESAKV